MIPSTTLARYEQHALGVLRIVTAVLFIGHAVVKLFGFPPGAAPGPQALTSLFGIAGLIELVVGVLILVGFQTRIAAFLAAGEMAIGYWTVHAPASIYPVANHGEGAILFCFIFLYLVFAGPGVWSVDASGGRSPVAGGGG
ncbi:DoxX family protein [Sphingomonas sp.]|uniref:DoxX family protein n=1 Tax=Sphingomonas sp. TaxID=28214 RepID=UPI00286A6459|nr:DoxX family protein [Sphingomonas sp.]